MGLRRRLLLVGLLLALAASGVSAAALGGGATPKLIHDSFAGSSIDSNVWGWYGTNQPDSVSISQVNGALTVGVTSTAPNDFNAGLGTRCKARGDFDARLTFDLAAWPAENGVWVSLNTNTNGYNAYRVSWHFDSVEEAYGAYLPDANPDGGLVASTDRTGTLRLTRTESTWSAYFQSVLGDWVQIASGAGPSQDIEFIANIFNLSNVLQFGGQATTVKFTKFKVVADSVVCP